MSVYDELLENHTKEDVRHCVLTGIVKENYNKDYPGRVKVEYYGGEEGKNQSGWVRVASPYAGKNHGFYALPEVESEVVVVFEQGDMDCPIVIACLWGEKNTVPAGTVKEENTVKRLKTKGGHEILFDEEEEKGLFHILTPGKNKVTLSDEKKTITILAADEESKVVLDGNKGEITLDAKKKVVLSVGGNPAVTIDGSGKKVSVSMDNVSVEAKQKLELKGQGLNLQGQTSLDLKGPKVGVKADGNLDLEAGGIAKLKGSMLNLN